jgi:hypothetical protein
MEETFLKDLAEVLAKEQDLIKEYKATKTSIHIADTLTRILPSQVFDRLSRRAGRVMNRTGGSSRIPQAALYGISASLTNRRNIRKLITNLLDGMY